MASYLLADFHLAQKSIDDMRTHAKQEAQNKAESVGIIQNGEYIALINQAEDKTNHFKVSDSDITQYDIEVLVHSHLNHLPFLSIADFSAQQALNVPFILICDDEIKGFKSIKNLIGREFDHGTTDCYALIRDAYHLTGIDLPDFERDDLWWERQEQLYLNNIQSVGFYQVETPQIGDVILINLGAKEPCHGMIYIGDNQVLHHPPNRLSKRDWYDGYWLKYTHSIWRHKNWQPLNFTAILNNMAASSR